jgi:hypothetical protein
MRRLLMANNQQPTHRVYSVIKRDGQDDFWLSIGAAFAHQDGKGFNVMLQALPIDGKVVLRVPQADEPEQPPANNKQRTERRGR